jgi:hypothetical protein
MKHEMKTSKGGHDLLCANSFVLKKGRTSGFKQIPQPPIQCVPGALSLVVKRPEREADHSPPSSAEVKNAWSYISTPPIRIHGVVLRDNFTFICTFYSSARFFGRKKYKEKL